MAVPGDRSEHSPAGIFDVRDHYRERQADDDLAATVPGPVRFAVDAVVTPAGRVEPRDWLLDIRRTLSGLAVFTDRIVEGSTTRVVRTLPASTTTVELTVSSPDFQAQDVTFAPSSGQRVQIDLAPAVGYPFGTISARPDQAGPSLLRGSIRDENDEGVSRCTVAVAQGLYDYRTEADGSWVVILPDTLAWGPTPAQALAVTVQVTLTPSTRWQTAQPLPEPGGGAPWTANGLVLTCSVTARRGATVSVPSLRLRLS